MKLKLGINSGPFPQAHSQVPGMSCVRAYRDTENDIPTVWPGVPGATTSTVSLRPHPDTLMNNTSVPDNGSGQTTLYGQVRYLAEHAPPGSKLTVWHEAGILYPNLSYITPTTMRGVHAILKQACAGTNVDYGVIITGDPDKMEPWIPTVTMDWYGIDVYVNGKRLLDADGHISQANVNAYLNEYRSIAMSHSGKAWPQIDVTETNAHDESLRGPLFKAIAQWLHHNGGYRLLTFYKGGGPLGGAWDAHDTATITALNWISSTY